MSYDSDEEQIEQLKRLWKAYGQPILVGVVVTLVCVFGYQTWKKSKYESVVAASQLYQNLLDTVSAVSGSEPGEEEEATINHVVERLQKDFSDTRYSVFGTLFLAQQQVNANELDKAVNSLEWILSQNPELNVEIITRIRLARVLLALPESKPADALKVLDSVKEGGTSFVASLETVRGDVYVALEQREKAQNSYQKALEAAQLAGQSRPLLQLKLDDLASLLNKD